LRGGVLAWDLRTGRNSTMVFFNWATMQMAAKIVYYGPGLCGKTSNLSYIYAKTSPNSRGEMVSLETESDRTLFFDLLPIEVGTIGGFKTRLQLYTVPGQVFYNTTRKLVLKGVDGLVFVADSQRPMRDANLESFASLVDNLKEFGLEPSEIPIVFQFNKRDLSNILTIDELNADLNPNGTFLFQEASAVNGDGVIPTLKEITKITLKHLRSRMSAPTPAANKGVVGSSTVRPVKPPRPAPAISAQSLARAAAEGAESAGENRHEASADVASEVPVAPAGAGSPPAEPPTEPPPQEAEPAAFESAEAAGPVGDEAGEPFPDAEITKITEDAPDVGAFNEDSAVIEVEFDTESRPGLEPPPPVKRVQVSNHMDILAELDGLRKQATMANGNQSFKVTTPDLDLDSLLSADTGQTRKLQRKMNEALNSDVFKNMRGLQVAIRIQGEDGNTIHTFDPVSLKVEDAKSLKRLCLKFSLDLENVR
jgi:signal recognition particle receptor subunit beta